MTMAKKRPEEGYVPKITITTGEEPPECNTTLLALLRDGERPKPGEPGTLADRLGAEVQAFMAEQMRVARFRRSAVKGKIALAISFVTGPDGSQTYAVECKTTTAKIPPGTSMVFADEDGELTGRPVEPLTELAYERERKINAAEPRAGAESKL